MRTRTASFLLVASLLLVGAGCMPATTAPDADETTTVTDGSTAPGGNGSTNGSSGNGANDGANGAEGARVVTTNGVVDETWQTYQNSALGFSFDWPTRGRYAPMWNVRFVGDGDLEDGCFRTAVMDRSHVSAGGATFCHAASPAESGTTSATDHYVTAIGDTNVLISFTKSSAGMGDDFSWDDYRSHLDLIISTFRRTE